MPLCVNPWMSLALLFILEFSIFLFLFFQFHISQTYLEPSQIYVMELFCENS